MNTPSLILIAMLGLGFSSPGHAQGWDPARKATGWAYQEVDGSLVFFDSEAGAFRTWVKGTGLTSSLSIALPPARRAAASAKPAPAVPRGATDYDAAAALLYGTPRRPRPQAAARESAPVESPSAETTPDRWVTDSYSRTWVTTSERLIVLGKDGKPDLQLTLPGPVEDLAVAPDGLLLLYRTLKPYLEKRDLRTGAVLWSFGEGSQLKEPDASPLRVPLNRMALGADGTVYLAEGASLTFTVLDPARGPKAPGQAFFTCQDALPSRASLGHVGRGPLLAWADRGVVFGVFTPSQVKSCGAPESRGLLLARFDLGRGTLDWLTTGLAEGHRLVGLLDTEAVFLAPGGGLAFTPIR
ncbi:MAG TPA: hypothetical protein VK150_07870 [Geothrix sp.]|nr:hypothetical protein [Geothrix sp.]